MTLARFTYPRIDNIISGTFTFSQGISPSTATLKTTPQSRLPAEIGTLRLVTGGSIIAQFPDCVVDSASLTFGRNGQIVSLRILDRRWKWEYGEINGHYNLRRSDNSLDPTYEKTPQELAELLLDAMGESGYDVSALPDDTRPTVNWVGTTPAPELQSLCDSLGCRVVLNLDNTVQIVRRGVGARLPATRLQSQSFGLDPPNKPDSIKVLAGPTLYQDIWKLEAVGRDSDGNIKPIDDLSYKPDGGWENEEPYFFSNVGGRSNARELALQTVFRWYRITEDQTNQTFKRRDCLPLKDRLVRTYEDDFGDERPEPAIVKGEYWNGNMDFQNVNEAYDGEFSINKEEGIVIFKEPVERIETSGSGENKEHRYKPADLRLETAHQHRDPETRLWDRVDYELQTPGNSAGTGPLVMLREDLSLQIQGGSDVNRTEVENELQRQARGKLADLQVVNSSQAQYAGLFAINLDGKIQQVSWTFGSQGAFTTASLNTEFDRIVPPYERRKELREQRELAKQQRAFENRWAWAERA